MEVAFCPPSGQGCLSASEVLRDAFTAVVQERRNLIPRSLLVVARSPMVKGHGAKTPKKWSLAGNYAVVTRAREMVVAFLTRGLAVHENWKERLDIPDTPPDEEPDTEAWTVPDEGLLCPSCSRPI